MTFSPNLVISATQEREKSKSETTPILRRRAGEDRRKRGEKGAEDERGRVSLPILSSSTSLDTRIKSQQVLLFKIPIAILYKKSTLIIVVFTYHLSELSDQYYEANVWVASKCLYKEVATSPSSEIITN